MTELTASTTGGELDIPVELYRALGQPRRIIVTPRPSSAGGLNLHPQPVADALRRAVLRTLRQPWLLRRWLGPAKVFPVARRTAVGDRQVRFRVGPGKVEVGAWGICNRGYDGPFSLLPVGEGGAGDRQQWWGNIEDYHEHRAPDDQRGEVESLSQWLVAEIFTTLDATSFLELGCGAGRNLRAIARAIPGAELHGLDVNAGAIEVAQGHLPGAELAVGSIYDLAAYADQSIDVVFTVGVLMHVPHEAVEGVVREMHRIARRGVVHYEFPGRTYRFDFQRYPRDYAALYERLALGTDLSAEVPVLERFRPAPRKRRRDSKPNPFWVRALREERPRDRELENEPYRRAVVVSRKSAAAAEPAAGRSEVAHRP